MLTFRWGPGALLGAASDAAEALWRPTIVLAIACLAAALAPARAAAGVDAVPFLMPPPGTQALRVLSPTVLELEFVQTVEKSTVDNAGAGAAPRKWSLDRPAGTFNEIKPAAFEVKVGGKPVNVRHVGFKRRPIYAPLSHRDLRVATWIYLHLAEAVIDQQEVEVRCVDGTLWDAAASITATAVPLRGSPANHVNQEGYAPRFPKIAMVGHYLGSLGELIVQPGTDFWIVKAGTSAAVYRGKLQARPDVGYNLAQAPYQQVLEADFSAVREPGSYQLVVPGIGASVPFRIDEGVFMNFARTYALGIYHQRCGTTNELPFTRFLHAECHRAPALVPLPAEEFATAWSLIAKASENFASDPKHSAPQLKDPASQLYPFAREGRVDVAGGHHDAGDYSKYTTNSAGFVHTLVFAVDALAGVAEFDNLGLPESGDGVPDILQEAKWEADFLAKLQDEDGGFHFLVYPRARRYENNVLPDAGDEQIVWPKNTAATAAAVAALAQAGSSPRMRRHFPTAADDYLKRARKGWEFLEAAIAQHGRDGAYQKLTHYGHLFRHDDELAWAACELFLATGEARFHEALRRQFDPGDDKTRRWGWWRLSESYGNAIRSYAFAVKSGRREQKSLDPIFLERCEREIDQAGRDALRWSEESAYGTSFPAPTKRMRGGGWYFSLDQAFDIAVASQLDFPPGNDPRARMLEAFIANLNFEAGTNPVNRSYVTGLGVGRQREIVHQFAQVDERVLPPSGIPIGNLQSGQPWIGHYERELGALSYPADGDASAPYAFYDRWTDTHNVATEFVIVNQARALAGLAWLAAKTDRAREAWRPVAARITGVPAKISSGEEIEAQLVEPRGFNLRDATIVWEASGREPARGVSLSFRPEGHGRQWVEVEANWPDGRRLFGRAEFDVDNGLPEVAVKVLADTASVADGSKAVIEFKRTGDLTRPMVVNFHLGGTAAKWTEYRRVEGDMPVNVTIPAGVATTTMTLVPVAEGLADKTRELKLTLAKGDAYNVGRHSSATVKFVGKGK